MAHRSDCLCQDCQDDHAERLRELAEGVEIPEPRRLESPEAAPKAAEAEPADQKSAIKELWIGYSELRYKPIPFLTAKDAHEWLRNVPRNYGKCSVRHFRQVDAQAPESQPHKVHPWDALQAIRESLASDSGSGLSARRIVSEIKAAVEKLPVGIKP